MIQTPSAHAVFEYLDAAHRDIEIQLQTLNALTSKLDGPGLTKAECDAAMTVLAFFRNEARHHHLDEEKHIFPTLLLSGEASVAATARHLTQDHGWLEQTWLEIDPGLEAAAMGNAWFDVAELRHAVSVFTALYHDHMSLEESVAYPMAHSRLHALSTEGMGREMAHRRSAALAH